MSLGNSLTYTFSAGRPIRSGRNENGERGVLYAGGVLMVHNGDRVTVYRTNEFEHMSADGVAEFFAEYYPLPD